MTSRVKNSLAVLIGITLLAFCIRLISAAVWQDRLGDSQALAFGDSDGYLVLAERLSTGQPYEYGWEHASAFRSPGYPLLLAPLFWLCDERPVFASRLLGAFLGAIATFLLGQLGTALVSRKAGLIAALLMAFYPGAIGSSIFILAEAPFVPCMLISLLCLTETLQQSIAPSKDKGAQRSQFNQLARIFAQHRNDLGLGISSGIATLIRPSWLLFIPALFVFLPFFGISLRKTWKTSFIAGLAMLVVLAPWTLRNELRLGKFIPTTTQTGSSLYDGLGPQADGSSNMDFVAKARLEYLAEVRRQELPGTSSSLEPKKLLDPAFQPTAEYWPKVQEEIHLVEAQLPDWNFETGFDRYLRDEALAWTQRHPNQVAILAKAKFVRMWSPTPNASYFQSPPIKYTLGAITIAVWAFALGGLFYRKRANGYLAVILIPALYFTLLHLVFVSSVRYREPAMIVLLISVSVAMTGMFERWQRSRRLASSTGGASNP